MGVFKRLFSSIFDLIPGFDKPSATSPVTTTSADDFYNKLVSDSSDPNFQPTAGLPSGGAGGGGGTSGSWDGSNLPGYINQPGRDGGIPLPAGGGPGSAQAGKAAATALFNAGFRNRKDLETITAISWRESKWNPLSKNQYTSDRGLMQINMAAHKALMQQMHYTEADLMDEQKNANIAYRLWSQGGGNYASFQQLWGFSEHSPYSEPVHGQPGWDKNGDPLGRTQGSNATQVVASSGLPVVGDVGFSSMAAVDQMRYQAGQGTSVTFHNVFNLDNTGTSSGGGMDIRRTASRVADVLEAEMNKRLARSN
jgi:hypothetical protein